MEQINDLNEQKLRINKICLLKINYCERWLDADNAEIPKYLIQNKN